MATNPPPGFLFRFWDPNSSGKNTTTEFHPAGNASNTSPTSRGALLQNALLGRSPEVPFTSFYDSLLVALVHAGHCQQSGRRDIHLTCIHTRTTKLLSGEPARFVSLDDLVQEWNANVTDRAGNPTRYPGKWISTMPILLGEGSCTVRFDTLVEQGLYELYPTIKEARSPNDTERLYAAISMLRLFGFGWERPLTRPMLDTAAKLATAFHPSTGNQDSDLTQVTLSKLTAWFLSLQKRDSQDPQLRVWIYNNLQLQSTPQLNKAKANTIVTAPERLPSECSQYLQLSRLFTGKVLRPSPTYTSIDAATTQAAMEEWELWHRSGRSMKARKEPATDKKPAPPRPTKRSFDGGYTHGYELRRKHIPLCDGRLKMKEWNYRQRHNATLREEKISDADDEQQRIKGIRAMK